LFARVDGVGALLVLTVCKSKSTFDIGAAKPKMAAVHEFLRASLADSSSPIVKAGIARADQVTLVFAVFRDATGVLVEQIKAVAVAHAYEFGVAVASKEQLRKLYGPTLAPMFDFQSSKDLFASDDATRAIAGTTVRAATTACVE